MDHKQPVLLNGLYVKNWNNLGQTVLNGSEVLPTANAGEITLLISNSVQNEPQEFDQKYPILNTLLDFPQTDPTQEMQLPQFIEIEELEKQEQILPEDTAHQAAETDHSDTLPHVNLEHDYIKYLDPEEPERSKEDSVFLTINLTKYAKGVNLKDIRGIVLLLKDTKKNPPIIINDVNLHSSDEDEDAVETNNDSITSVEVNDVPPESVDLQPESVDVQPKSVNVPVAAKVPNRTYYNCKYCPGFSNSIKELKKHIRRDHSDRMKKYDCLTCRKSYLSRLMLQRHRKRVHFIHCGYCDQSYEKVRDYKIHVKETHTGVFYRMCKPFYCEDCDKEIGDKSSYLTHLRTHGGHVCNICGERTTSLAEHKAHLDTHPDKYFCPKCNKGFKLKESLKAHDETHNDPYRFACDECGKAFKTKSTVAQHKKIVHSVRERKYMCDQCPKMFLFHTNLVRHQECVHAGIRHYECDQCDRKFSNSGNLKLHIDVMHLKVQPYQCEYCGKRFARKDYVVNHSKIHTKSGIKKEPDPGKIKHVEQQPVECKICGKIFISSITLKHHMKYIHNGGIRKFKCRHCDLKFKFKTTRMQHEKLHEDPVNKFVCPICWKKMEKKEDLEAHLYEHKESSKSYNCDFCDEVFSSRQLLDDHVYSAHVEEQDDEEL